MKWRMPKSFWDLFFFNLDKCILKVCIRHRHSKFVFISESQRQFALSGSVCQTFILGKKYSWNWSFKGSRAYRLKIHSRKQLIVMKGNGVGLVSICFSPLQNSWFQGHFKCEEKLWNKVQSRGQHLSLSEPLAFTANRQSLKQAIKGHGGSKPNDLIGK